MQPKTLLLLPMLLAACLPAKEPAQPGPDACGASGYQSLVGVQLAAVTLPRDLDARIIHPDTVVTMEYNPERLNIKVNRAGVIEAVTCG